MPTFLIPNATTQQRIHSAVVNHISWFRANAEVSGGDTHQATGIIWTVAGTDATIAFPQLGEGNTNATLDAIIAECRRRNLERIACWSLFPPQPQDLGIRLMARGFEWGWRPHWMALDLSETLPPMTLPDTVTVTIDDDCDWDIEDLPYYDRADAKRLHALTQTTPRHTWHFVARLDGTVVGHSALHVTTGASGVGGIYNVGVVPHARHLGIGSAVSLAACQFAKNIGCPYALLNSAADGLYEKIGFQSLGYGQTWWMHTPALRAPAPTQALITFIEAIGHGDIAALDAIPLSDIPGDLNAALPNGMTPIEVAVKTESTASADWLVAKGATLDILEAWDLYGESHTGQILADAPELVNRRVGDWQTTLLHEAVQRDDIALARFLLAASADVTIQDSQFHGTPLGWARHMERAAIADLLQNYQSPD